MNLNKKCKFYYTRYECIRNSTDDTSILLLELLEDIIHDIEKYNNNRTFQLHYLEYLAECIKNEYNHTCIVVDSTANTKNTNIHDLDSIRYGFSIINREE